jgi:hypothetical protein
LYALFQTSTYLDGDEIFPLIEVVAPWLISDEQHDRHKHKRCTDCQDVE